MGRKSTGPHSRRGTRRHPRSHRPAHAESGSAGIWRSHAELPGIECAGGPGGLAPDCGRRASGPSRRSLPAAWHRSTDDAGRNRQGRRGMAAFRCRYARRAHCGLPSGRGGDRPGQLHRTDVVAGGLACQRVGGRSFAGAHAGAGSSGRCVAVAPGLCHLHLRIDRQAQGHRDQPGQHLSLFAQ